MNGAKSTKVVGRQQYLRRTVPDLLERSRALHGVSWPVFYDLSTRREFTFGEFLNLVAGAASHLVQRYEPGSRIAVLAGNGAEYFVLRYALACAGLVEVALNGLHRGPVLEHMLEVAGPCAIVVEDAYLDNLASAAGLRGADRIGSDELRAMTSQPIAWANRPEVDIRSSDPCRIVFTSGTTGRSKGVELSHAYEVHTGERHNGLLGIGPGDRWLYATPMFHIDAIYIASIVFHTGAAMVVAPNFSVSRFWQDVEASGATYFSHLGATIGLLLKGNDPPATSSLRLAVGGGASIAQIEQAERRFNIRILEAFAMTECIACTINRHDERRMGSAGRAIDGYEVAIIDAHEAMVASGKVGEIVVRTGDPGGLFSGYVDDAEATAQAMRGGWFHTGDLGVLDDDGYLTYRGRLKDAIRVKGENISAMELESIAELHPAVTRAAAVGLAADIGDEDILLFVECGRADVDPETLRSFIKERAAPFLIPRFINVVDRLPLTATGKVDKTGLPRALP
jgi:crotonobetaine/carnitine-CoA ligase